MYTHVYICILYLDVYNYTLLHRSSHMLQLVCFAKRSRLARKMDDTVLHTRSTQQRHTNLSDAGMSCFVTVATSCATSFSDLGQA